MNPTMPFDQALNVLDQACAAHQGNRQDHLLLQQAMFAMRQTKAELDEANKRITELTEMLEKTSEVATVAERELEAIAEDLAQG